VTAKKKLKSIDISRFKPKIKRAEDLQSQLKHVYKGGPSYIFIKDNNEGTSGLSQAKQVVAPPFKIDSPNQLELVGTTTGSKVKIMQLTKPFTRKHQNQITELEPAKLTKTETLTTVIKEKTSTAEFNTKHEDGSILRNSHESLQQIYSHTASPAPQNNPTSPSN